MRPASLLLALSMLAFAAPASAQSSDESDEVAFSGALAIRIAVDVEIPFVRVGTGRRASLSWSTARPHSPLGKLGV